MAMRGTHKGTHTPIHRHRHKHTYTHKHRNTQKTNINMLIFVKDKLTRECLDIEYQYLQFQYLKYS